MDKYDEVAEKIACGVHYADISHEEIADIIRKAFPGNDKIRKILNIQEVHEAIGRFRGVAKFFDIGDDSAECDGNTLADAIESVLSEVKEKVNE